MLCAVGQAVHFVSMVWSSPPLRGQDAPRMWTKPLCYFTALLTSE